MDRNEFKKAFSIAKTDLTKNQLNDRINVLTLKIFDSIDQNKGNDNSLDIIREEPAEMIQAVSKMIRHGDEEDWYGLLEEVADVLIAIDMIRHIFHIDKSEIDNAKYVKLKRFGDKINETGYIK